MALFAEVVTLVKTEYKTLIRANLKQHKGTLAGIFFLTLLVAVALGTVLSVWTNSGAYIETEMQRAGFGEITAWVSNIDEISVLTDSIESLPEVDKTETQSVVFSNYTANGQESDSEGQLIVYSPSENGYKFFTDDMTGYAEQPNEIASGEIYVSPSMVSMFDIKLGDEITFPIARAGKNAVFTVKGFYEDPFMGSSMIGMKGFLISEADRADILSLIGSSGIDALARGGYMIHIFSGADLSEAELNGVINENSELAKYAEFVHGKNAISGFMLILHNAFCGLLLAFAAVLLFVVTAVLGHSIGSTIETDTVNMGILKTVGFTSKKLRIIQLAQYLIGIVCGMIAGVLLSIPLSVLVSGMTLTTVGIRIPTSLPVAWIVPIFAAILLLLTGFIILGTRKIVKIAPMAAIRRETETPEFDPQRSVSVFGKAIHLRLALRQLLTGKRRYIGALITAALLVFFASLTGRMNSWLGADGKGMMDAFNPADHDLGVQVFGNLTSEEAEETVRGFSEITDTYLLAMPGVAVNGVDYTANVISEPERFHILEGKTCEKDNEIVLTEFVAAHFGVLVGDTVTVRGDSGSGEYIVSGIYSCANDMGDNVGMSREGYLKIGKDNPHIWCWHYFLDDPSQKTAITEALETAYGGDIHVHENTWPGLFGIISAMHALLAAMYVMVILFILIVTVMTSEKLLSAEQRDLGIYKAVGFETNALRLTFALRFGMTAFAGSVIGTFLAALLTDPLVSAVMKLAGISNFSSSPSFGSIILPSVTVILLFTFFAYMAAGKMKKTDLTMLITE